MIRCTSVKHFFEHEMKRGPKDGEVNSITEQ